MRDLDRLPLTPVEIERIERNEARIRVALQNAKAEMRRLHALSARGEAEPLTFTEKMRLLLPGAP